MFQNYTAKDARRDSDRAIKESADRRHEAKHRKDGTTCLLRTTTLRHIQLLAMSAGIVALLSFNGLTVGV